MESTQVINNLMSDMLDIIEKENLDYGFIQQELKNLQDIESLSFPEVVSPIFTAPKKNKMDLTHRMNNLIAEIKSDINNRRLTWSNLKNVS